MVKTIVIANLIQKSEEKKRRCKAGDEEWTAQR